MSLYDMYETDPDMEQGGVILNYGDGIRIKVARAGGSNANFVTVFERISRPYRKRLDSGTLSEELAHELYIQVHAEAVVKDWEGVTDRDGKVMKFSVDNCVKLFKELPDLFADVREAANSISNYRLKEIEDDIKN